MGTKMRSAVWPSCDSSTELGLLMLKMLYIGRWEWFTQAGAFKKQHITVGVKCCIVDVGLHLSSKVQTSRCPQETGVSMSNSDDGMPVD